MKNHRILLFIATTLNIFGAASGATRNPYDLGEYDPSLDFGAHRDIADARLAAGYHPACVVAAPTDAELAAWHAHKQGEAALNYFGLKKSGPHGGGSYGGCFYDDDDDGYLASQMQEVKMKQMIREASERKALKREVAALKRERGSRAVRRPAPAPRSSRPVPSTSSRPASSSRRAAEASGSSRTLDPATQAFNHYEIICSNDRNKEKGSSSRAFIELKKLAQEGSSDAMVYLYQIYKKCKTKWLNEERALLFLEPHVNLVIEKLFL